jgi:hypothetical protein
MPYAGLDPAITGTKRPRPNAVDRAVTDIGQTNLRYEKRLMTHFTPAFARLTFCNM